MPGSMDLAVVCNENDVECRKIDRQSCEAVSPNVGLPAYARQLVSGPAAVSFPITIISAEQRACVSMATIRRRSRRCDIAEIRTAIGEMDDLGVLSVVVFADGSSITGSPIWSSLSSHLNGAPSPVAVRFILVKARHLALLKRRSRPVLLSYLSASG